MLASVGGVLLLVAAGTHPTGAFTSSSLSTSRRRHTGTTVRMGMGNSWGRLFRISTWGESHGGGVGVVVDGVPPPEVQLARRTDLRSPRRGAPVLGAEM